MGAIEEIFAKPVNEVGLDDLQKLIDEKREETRTLEYKDPQILKNPGELSEWVSALLNADGGLIILGLCESDSKKKDNINPKIYPIKMEFVESKYTKESIDQIVFSNIGCSTKPDIKIYPIRDCNDPLKAIYLIEIPSGDNPPYQAHNNKYYRRLNATKYELPHSEIADFFSRRRKPKLNVLCFVNDPWIPDQTIIKKTIESGLSGMRNERQDYNLRIFIKNIGHAAAKYARVIVTLEDISIVKIDRGRDNRIDGLREGKTTLQWDNSLGIIYADSKVGELLWDLQVKLNKDKIGIISYEAYAEDMATVEDKYVLLPYEVVKIGQVSRPYPLPRYQDFYKE
jgi:hypothetical protein